MNLFRPSILFLLLSASTIPVIFSQDTCLVKGYSIGETIVSVEQNCFNPCNAGVVFINVHDNEKTSVHAAREYLLPNGGKLITIYNKGQRFLSFRLKGKLYYFDPNRIFSEAGRISTLKLLSAKYSESAENELSYFADKILTNYIDSSKLVIALHNNTDGNLSVITYLKDQEMGNHWGAVFVNPEMDPDDFVLTTDSTIFQRIVEKNINAVWENVDSVKDDGSLSVYAGRNKIAYINVEAEHDHVDEQCAMLAALDEIIKEYTDEKEETDELVSALESSSP